MKTAVVTGVSSGIGRATALALAGAGYRVFGSVRRPEDAAAFEVAAAGVTALRFDLRHEAAIRQAASRVAAECDGLDLLVNSAGIAQPGALEFLPLAAFREQVEINLTGVLAVTQAFLPLLKAARGRIVNISSVAGRNAMPFLGAYSASKFGLEALSDSLRRELAPLGVEVVVIQPGGVATPIWAKAADADARPYAGTHYEAPLATFTSIATRAGDGGMPAEKVAALVLRIAGAKRPRPRYLLSRAATMERVMSILPARLLDRAIAGRLGLRRRRG